MDKDGRPDVDVGFRAAATPKIVNTIIDGKLVQVDLNIAISCGDLGLDMKGCAGDKGTRLFNTRETKKKEGRIVSTFIKGRLQKINLDSIEAKEQQMKLLDGDQSIEEAIAFESPKISSSQLGMSRSICASPENEEVYLLAAQSLDQS